MPIGLPPLSRGVGGVAASHRRSDHGERDRVVSEEGAQASREDAPSGGAAQPCGHAEGEEGEVGCEERLAKLRGPPSEAADDASHAVDDVDGANLVGVRVEVRVRFGVRVGVRVEVRVGVRVGARVGVGVRVGLGWSRRRWVP